MAGLQIRSMLAAARVVVAEREVTASRKVEQDQSDVAVRARCKTLHGFLSEAWHILEPTTPFIDGWAVKAICDHLQAVTEGDFNRLLINVPPGFAKSLIVSVFWPAYEWGPAGRPSMRYLTAAYEEGLAIRDSTKMRRLVKSDWYQDLWPIEIASDQDAKTDFANTASGSRTCRAFNSLTGGRGDRVIIDDPHSVKTAESEKVRDETIKTFLEAVPHRINTSESAIVVIMQRLHEGDVSGVILSHNLGYVHLMLPMEFEPERRCETLLGFRDPRMYEGELLAPERMDRNAVELLKRSLLGYGTASQLQQRPSPRGGLLFKPDLITMVGAVPASTLVKTVRGWDFAGTEARPGRDPDWTAGVKIGRDDQGFFYILDVVRLRATPAAIENTVKSVASQDGGNCWQTIPKDPGQAGKAQASAYTRALAGKPVKELPTSGSKVERATPAAAQVEAGNVRMLEGDWNKPFLDELRTFPTGRHDDQVDAFADAMSEIALVAPWEGLFEYTRQEAVKALKEISGERDVPAPEDMVRILPPPGAPSSAYGRSGEPYQKDAHGVMTVHPDDAPAFLSLWGWKRAPAPEGEKVDG